MCGIAGVLGVTAAAARSVLARMDCQLQHRGPDSNGTFVTSLAEASLGLGHRRLSILDLSPLGHQPMQHPATGDVLVFNGEIYNFRALRRRLESEGEVFRSSGDTEVLLTGLSRRGSQFLGELEGMYALAFFRAADRSLLLARDPMGIKPLYLARHGKQLVFASEVRAILATGLIPDDLDVDGLSNVLAFGSVQHPKTIFKHISSFPPGHFQVLTEGGRQNDPEPFWSYPSADYSITEPEAIARIQSTLDVAVRDHLESDVPVGVFLSSGLDSTVIAAVAAKHSRDIRSFTVGFQDEPDLSELALARETAKLFGLQHREVFINGDAAEETMVKWLQSMDQPSIDGLNIYVISQAIREQEIKVALSGQGGDELFGGYPSFRDVPRLKRWMSRVRWLPPSVRRVIGRLATSGRSDAVRQKMDDVMSTDGSLAALYLQRRRVMSSAQLRQLGLSDAMIQRQSHIGIPQASQGDVDDIATLSRLESSLYQGNMLLRDGDANGMAHGLEIRLPIIDRRMLDLMHSLPGSLRLRAGMANKQLMRVAFAPYLRPAILSQPKRGFTLPIRRWMRGPLRELCEHAITQLKLASVFDAGGIDDVWRSFLSDPESPMWTRALTLCVLGTHLHSTRQKQQAA